MTGRLGWVEPDANGTVEQGREGLTGQGLGVAVRKHELGLTVLESKNTAFVVFVERRDIDVKVANTGTESLGKDGCDGGLVILEGSDRRILREPDAREELTVLDSGEDAGVEGTNFAASGMQGSTGLFLRAPGVDDTVDKMGGSSDGATVLEVASVIGVVGIVEEVRKVLDLSFAFAPGEC